MWISDFYLKVQGGIAVVIPSDGIIDRQRTEEAQLYVTERGLSLVVEEYEVPIPESLFEYFSENRVVTFYIYNGTTILLDPVFSTEISWEGFLENKAVYFYKKEEEKKLIEKAEKEEKDLLRNTPEGDKNDEHEQQIALINDFGGIDNIKKNIIDEFKRIQN